MAPAPLRRRTALALALCVAASCADSGETQPPPAPAGPAGLFTELAAVHAPSAPTGSIAVTPDGALAIVGEGGAVAFLDATSEEGLHVERKRVAVGDEGVLSVALALDPEADPLGDPDGAANVLYVAGGRSGLWAMRADPRAGAPNRAARIDDATLAAPGASQDGRRWCCAVDFVELGGARYLAALFAARDDSRLRLYPLEAARAATLAPEGAPTELAAAAEAVLAANPGWQPAAQSFAHGLAVDGADVYVALGCHGVVRARFDPATLAATVDGGPVFGDDSHYAREVDGVLYDDFHMYSPSDDPVVIYDEPPVCLDVAVHRSGPAHHLYAAVDELGWLRFDLSQRFAPSMPIEHQEGLVVPTPHGERQVLLVEEDSFQGAPARMGTYARALDLLETPSGPALAVACAERAQGVAPGVSTEGRSLNHLGLGFRGSGSGIAGVSPALEGTYSYTLLYDLAAPLAPDACNFAGRVRAGAWSVVLRNAPEPPGLLAFGGGAAREEHEGEPGGRLAHASFAARFDWPPAGGDPEWVWVRSERHRPGRFAYDLSFSVLAPTVLMTGGNDAGLAADGILVDCGGTIEPDYEPDPLTGADPRGTNGILFDPGARCPAAGFPGDEHWWNVGISGEGPRWRLARFHPGSGACGAVADPPDLVRETFFESPPDLFQDVGRQYFSGGGLDVRYDAAVQGLPGRAGQSFVFASRVGTPEGIVVFRRDLLAAAAEQHPDGALIDPDRVPGAELGVLETHPEFSRVDPTHPDAREFLRKVDEDGFVLTFFPELYPLPDAAAPGGERWMLAVPAGAVRLDPNHPVFHEPANPPEDGGYHPEWAPGEPWESLLDRAMVRVFDASDPTLVAERCTLVAPFERSAAYRVEARDVAGRTYLFVADFGGRVFVYDASALAGLPPGAVVTEVLADWESPTCVTDALPNNVYGLAVDRAPASPAGEAQVYVGVARVGLCVLRFAPGAPAGERLELVRIVQTPGDAAGLMLRPGASPADATLLVADSHAGLRIFRRSAD